jgi:antitoxin (DNA-binding transcriptional repressor) of toxin-antitoxin stability system
MRTAQVSELKDRLDEVIEAVKNGETVEIREGDTSLAEVVPCSNGERRPQQRPSGPSTTHPDQTALYAHLDELVRQGKARRGTGKLPDDFFTRPRPKLEGGSVLEQLLRDREDD